MTSTAHTDVKKGCYYYNAVLWAVENGITKGTTETTFSPNETCNRAQALTLLWRSQGSPEVEYENRCSCQPLLFRRGAVGREGGRYSGYHRDHVQPL